MMMAVAVLVLALLMRGDVPQNKKYIILACLLMFALYGLRDAYTIGGDSSSSYLHSFQDMEDTTWAELREDTDMNENLFWNLIVKVGHTVFGGDYQLFILVISAFVMIIFGRFIYRYSSSPVQSFVYYWGLWFYTFNFNALKQSLAMALVLLAFDAILERKLTRFLITITIASLFHFPSLVFLPAYWIVEMNPRRGFLVVLTTALVAIYLWRDQILTFIVQFYYESDRVFEGEDRFVTGKVAVMAALVLVAYFLRPPEKGNRVYSASLQFVAIATVIQLFSVYNNVFERLADYYFQFSVIFVPLIFTQKTHSQEKAKKSLIFAVAPYVLGVLCLYRFNDIVMRETSHLLPYKFFFQSNGPENVHEFVTSISMILE